MKPDLKQAGSWKESLTLNQQNIAQHFPTIWGIAAQDQPGEANDTQYLAVETKPQAIFTHS